MADTDQDLKIDITPSADPPSLKATISVPTAAMQKVFDTIEDPAEYKLFYEIFYLNRFNKLDDQAKIRVLDQLIELILLVPQATKLRPGLGTEVADPGA